MHLQSDGQYRTLEANTSWWGGEAKCVWGHACWEVKSLAGPHQLKGLFEDYDLVLGLKARLMGMI